MLISFEVDCSCCRLDDVLDVELAVDVMSALIDLDSKLLLVTLVFVVDDDECVIRLSDVDSGDVS